jgi:hypothetical protein
LNGRRAHRRATTRIRIKAVHCWNAFCIATDCDGVAHVDATGDFWNQAEGTAFNPATGAYDMADTQIVNDVWTDYRRS